MSSSTAQVARSVRIRNIILQFNMLKRLMTLLK